VNACEKFCAYTKSSVFDLQTKLKCSVLLFDQVQDFFADVVEADGLGLGAVVKVVFDYLSNVGAEVFPSVALCGEIFGAGFGIEAATGFFCYVENDFAHYGKFAHGPSVGYEFCGSLGEEWAE
jgi:hypothetical protein